MLWGVSALKCYVFQKSNFSKFSIDRTYCSTDQKCNTNFGYILLASIGAQLVLDQSKLIFDRSNLIFDWSNIGQWVFKQVFLSRAPHTFKLFSKALSLYLLNRSILSEVCRFLPKFSQGFCHLVFVSHFYPLFFILFTIFMHFTCILHEIFELNIFGVFDF